MKRLFACIGLVALVGCGTRPAVITEYQMELAEVAVDIILNDWESGCMETKMIVLQELEAAIDAFCESLPPDTTETEE